jgi:hypothetical protein
LVKSVNNLFTVLVLIINYKPIPTSRRRCFYIVLVISIPSSINRRTGINTTFDRSWGSRLIQRVASIDPIYTSGTGNTPEKTSIGSDSLLVTEMSEKTEYLIDIARRMLDRRVYLDPL